MQRRHFLALSVHAAAAAAIARAEEVDAERVEPGIAVLRAEKAVQRSGWLTIEHGYDFANRREADLRRPVIVAPGSSPDERVQFRLVAVQIATSVVAQGRGVVLLPCPRDMGDQLHVGCTVSVVQQSTDGNAEQPIEHEASIVYTTPGADGGYVNPFVRIAITDLLANGPLIVRALHWIVLPTYENFAPSQLGDVMPAKQARGIQQALSAAVAVEYDATIQADTAPIGALRGDCSVRAFTARRTLTPSEDFYIEVLEGYRFRLPSFDRATGGCHFENVVVTPQGLLVFDAAGGSAIIGPPVGFITTAVGASYAMKDLGDKVWTGSNRGLYQGFKSFGNAALSTAEFGADRERIAALQAPRELADYAAALWQERRKRTD